MAGASAAAVDGAWGPELQALSARLCAERRVSEVAAALREGLDEAGSAFSYARARGLRRLCAAVSRFADSEPHCAALRELLHGRLEVDVLSLLLGRSLADGAAGPAQQGGAAPLASHAPDEEEAAAAAALLRGVCLLDSRTRHAAAQLGGVELLLSRAAAAAPAGPLRPAALAALAAMLADAPAAQAEFTRLKGAAQVAALAAPPGSDAAASAFLSLALGGGLLEGDAQRSADEAVRAALGPDAPARLAAAAVPVA